ncbi:MAG: PAS domain S-box protein [Desulfobacteraceae bacterium]|nr:MAG: PAS domain S-box protein [Desulfobacteraceae bacterium]
MKFKESVCTVNAKKLFYSERTAIRKHLRRNSSPIAASPGALKQPQDISLKRIYSLIILAGVVMQALIFYGYYNGERLNRMTSPLLAAVREVRLEAGAAQHEISDILHGRADIDNPNPWLYLDQAIWYLQNLVNTRQLDLIKWTLSDGQPDEPADPIMEIQKHLDALKNYFAQQAPPNSPQEIGELKYSYDLYFDAFLNNLNRIETGILQSIASERMHYHYTHIGLILFCLAMTLLVGFTVHRYERRRRQGYSALNEVNQRLQCSEEQFRGLFEKLQASYEFLQIANRHTDIHKMLGEFISAILSKTGFRSCAVRILDDTGYAAMQARGDMLNGACDLNRPLALASNRSICAQILRNQLQNELPATTTYGSFVIPTCGPEEFQSIPTCAEKGCFLREQRALGLIPIRIGDQILGLIQIADRKPGLLTRDMLEVIETAAMQIGTAVQRMRAEDALKTAYSELEKRVQERTLALSRINTDLQCEVEERRRAEERLRKSRNTLQTVIDGIQDALMLVDNDLHIRMLNRTAMEIFGVTAENAIGRNCRQVACANRIGACAACRVPESVAKGEVLTFERPFMKDGEGLEQVSIYPVSEKEQEAGGAIIRITDITEQKRLEQQLIRSEKMASLGILVSSIAHEINNPNSFVTFNIPILRDYLEELTRISDQYAEHQNDLELFHMTYPEFRKDVFKLVDNIEHGASRISNFVANLREFSQNNGERRKTWIDLASVVEKVLSICRSQIKKGVKSFTFDISEKIEAIYVDEYSLEQVLLNLIVNAVQAADKNDSYVKLSAAPGHSWKEHTIIRVADNGCGMDPKTMRRVFDPFFTTKSPSEGTGLGLYVCHNLIQTLGGRIEVESQPDVGSTFTIVLPDKDRRKQVRGQPHQTQ